MYIQYIYMLFLFCYLLHFMLSSIQWVDLTCTVIDQPPGGEIDNLLRLVLSYPSLYD